MYSYLHLKDVYTLDGVNLDTAKVSTLDTAKVSRMLGRTLWLISSVSDKLIIRTIILCVSKFTSYFGLPYFIAYSSSIRISLVQI